MALCISHPFSSETLPELSKLMKTSTKVFQFLLLFCSLSSDVLGTRDPKPGPVEGPQAYCYSLGVQRVHVEVPE